MKCLGAAALKHPGQQIFTKLKQVTAYFIIGGGIDRVEKRAADQARIPCPCPDPY